MTDAEDTPIELPKTPSIYDSRWDRLIGKKKASKPDSNTRRLISRISILMICGMIIGLLFDRKLEGVLAVFPILFILWSTYFFGFIVYIIPFLTSKTFFPNPIRLAKDGLISITLTVLSYAYLYNTFGLNPPGNEMLYSQWDALYFSAVTFSTLGFGDFSPTPNMRLMAAFQAIIGNLHLGVIVAAAFLAVSKPLKDET